MKLCVFMRTHLSKKTGNYVPIHLVAQFQAIRRISTAYTAKYSRRSDIAHNGDCGKDVINVKEHMLHSENLF
jgi:hypothetical protein